MLTLTEHTETIKYRDHVFLAKPTLPCKFSLGQLVDCEESGLKFCGVKVVGFAKPDDIFADRFIHVSKENYIFPVRENQLSIPNDDIKKLVINNLIQKGKIEAVLEMLKTYDHISVDINGFTVKYNNHKKHYEVSNNQTGGVDSYQEFKFFLQEVLKK